MPAPNAIAAVLCTVLVAPALAQDPTPPVEREVVADALQDITTRLASRDLAMVAWGAHFAAKQRIAESVPALKRRLAELAQVPAEQRTFVQLALLDALVQNDARMTAAELEPFQHGFSYLPAFALRCRNPDPNRTWLREHCHSFNRDGPWLPWIAAGNALADLRDADFATDLLRAAAVFVTITVRDPADDDWWLQVEEESFTSGYACGSGRGVVVPAGYPPTALYSLEEYSTPGSTLLVRGPYAVHLRRIECTDHWLGNGGGHAVTDKDLLRHARMRHTWIARMLGREGCPLPLAVERGILADWHGGAALQVLVDREQTAVRADFRALVELCIAARLTSWNAIADAEPEISVVLRDARADKSEPLPAVPNGR